MNNLDLTSFLQQNQFIPDPERSISDGGMCSKVDAFDNGVVLIRVVVDRGQSFIDLGRSGTDIWTDVFTLVSRTDPAFQVKTGSFVEAVHVLLHYWPTITASL